MGNIFVVSDIHGQYDHFEEILNFWNAEDQLVILGDLIDRGPKSLQVIQKVMALKQQYAEQVTFIKGNHEDMLINFLHNPTEKYEHYYRNGGHETMLNFLTNIQNAHIDISSVEEEAKAVSQHYVEELLFLANAPIYKIIGNVLFTHAGFNSEFTTINETTEIDFIWIRKHYEKPNQTGYVNVFGHTPVKYIHESNDIWMSEDKLYIAIDGGCYMTGQLNAVKLNEQGKLLEIYKVNK